jgi:cytochrome c1
VSRRALHGPLACLAALALGGCDAPGEDGPTVRGGDADRGRATLARLECGVCHVIPGVPGVRGHLGPSLAQYRHRVYLAGRFPNTPEVLVRWLLDPPSMLPDTAMPALDVTEAEARDMAAYLYTLE